MFFKPKIQNGKEADRVLVYKLSKGPVLIFGIQETSKSGLLFMRTFSSQPP